MQNQLPIFTHNYKYILIVHVYYEVHAIINFQLYFRKILTSLTIIRDLHVLLCKSFLVTSILSVLIEFCERI